MAATARESLKGINAYPIPARTIESIAESRGLDLTADVTEVCTSVAYRLCRADILMWLSLAPNISQGGQQYNFSEEQREKFRQMAEAIFDSIDEVDTVRPKYGYKGHRI